MTLHVSRARGFYLAGLGLVACLSANAPASELIFRPGPGLNDGTDNGGLRTGMDTTGLPGCLGMDGTTYYVAGEPRSACNNCNEKGYIRFDVSTLPTKVEQVFLGLEEWGQGPCFGGNCQANFYFYTLTESWDEIGLGAGTTPAPAEGVAVLGPYFRSSMEPVTPGGHREFDITEVYRGWKDGSIPNHGLTVYSPEGTCNNGAAQFRFYSSDDKNPSNRPYLRILTDTSIVGISLFSGNGTTPKGWAAADGIWNTSQDYIYVLGASRKPNGRLVNQPDTTVSDLGKGAYWLYAESTEQLGNNPKLQVTLADGSVLETVFKLTGTPGTANTWARAFGSIQLKLGWASGVADQVGSGESMVASGTNDWFMKMTYLGTIGGSTEGVTVNEVECSNVTTGQTVTFTPKTPQWNCEQQGMKAQTGDQIEQRSIGTAH